MKILKYLKFYFFALAVLSACKEKNTERNDSLVSKKQAYEYSEVLEIRPEKKITLPGDLKPWEEVKIYAKVKSFVKAVYVDRGKYVKKGQVLAILEAPELKAAKEETESELYASYADLEEIKARYEASRNSYNVLLKTSEIPGAVSQNEVQQAKARMLSDSARVKSTKQKVNAYISKLQSRKDLVQYLTIIAPFNGYITERNISPGALTGPDGVNMFNLVNTEKLRLTVAIPEAYSTALKDSCGVRFSISAFPGRKFNTCLSRQSQGLAEGVRALIAEFDIGNKDKLLRPGMYAEVDVPIQRKHKTLFVPRVSVVQSSTRSFIIRNNNAKAEWVDVRTGIILDTLIEVFGNVAAGDKIIKNATEEIRQNQSL